MNKFSKRLLTILIVSLCFFVNTNKIDAIDYSKRNDSTINHYVKQEYLAKTKKTTKTTKTAELPEIHYNIKKYQPKCSDVKVLTSIWSGATLLAPFLLLIFGAFDYFKAVMASDEQKMKEVKKKFPLRLIAFVLLLITPALLRVLLKNAGTKGAENTTYLKCIVTGDYGR